MITLKHTLILLCLVVSVKAQTAVYPGAVVTDNQLKIAANNVTSQLNQSINSSQVTWLVSSCSRIVPNMLITVGTEIMSVTGCTGTTMVVGGRGFDSTLASTHAQGQPIYAYIDAWHHNALRVEVEAIEQTLGTALGNTFSFPGSFSTALTPSQSPINPSNFTAFLLKGVSTGGVNQRGYVTSEFDSLPPSSSTTGNYVGAFFGVSNASGANGSNLNLYAFNTGTTVYPGFLGAAIGGEIDLDPKPQGFVSPALSARSAGLGVQLSGPSDYGNAFIASANDGTGAAINCDGTGECGAYLNGYVAANSYTGLTINTFSDSFPHTVSNISNTTPAIVTLTTSPVNCYGRAQGVSITGSSVSYFNTQWIITPISCTQFSLFGSVASGSATGGTVLRVADGGIQINMPASGISSTGAPINGVISTNLSEDTHGMTGIYYIKASNGSSNWAVTEDGSTQIGSGSGFIHKTWWGEATVTFTVGANAATDVSMAITGASAGDSAFCSPTLLTYVPPIGLIIGGVFPGQSGAGTVGVRFANLTGSPVTQTNVHYRCWSITPGA